MSEMDPGKQKPVAAVNPVAAVATDKVKSLEPSLSAEALAPMFDAALEVLEKAEARLPDHILLPSLSGADAGSEVPGAEPEPVYDARARASIQGNIIPGFNKDHQVFLFFQLTRPKANKEFLRWIAPLISSMDEVLSFVRAHRALRKRLGVREPPLNSTWVNIAFSHRAIAELVGPADAAAFGDASFRQGLAARSTYLGDPTRATHPGHRDKWVVGSPKSEADVLVIVAADVPGELEVAAGAIRRRAEDAGLRLMYEQRGDTLPGALRGHEHFGFKDGISQPGVRGKVSAAAGDFITPRYIDPADPRARYYARPGQPLVWPGEFLLGEPRQATDHLYSSAPAASSFPRWAARGSYLVCRRLRQDVPAFWAFVNGAATALGLPAQQFAAMLVGRWPSGAPVMRTPTADDLALAGDDWANNHFLFDDDTRPVPLRPIPGYPGDAFPQARQDVLGSVCPHFSHIRKINPRDSATDLGKPADTFLRLILRRGIPYGVPIVGEKRLMAPGLAKKERGLMFLCYGATIEEQFEFITRRWANSPAQPNLGGFDPIIGQRDTRGARGRFIEVPTPGGTVRLPLKNEWVIPTGGGYFFAPPIEAIAGVLGA
jgi:Dyp-type peroxidase family